MAVDGETYQLQLVLIDIAEPSPPQRFYRAVITPEDAAVFSTNLRNYFRMGVFVLSFAG